MFRWAHIRSIDDEEERNAAILAKYGIKPRPMKKTKRRPDSDDSSSDSDSSDSDDNIPDHVLKDDRLYQMYRERIRQMDQEEEEEEQGRRRGGGGEGSFSALRNLMSAMRQNKAEQSFEQSKQYFAAGPQDDDDAGAMESRNKAFEERRRQLKEAFENPDRDSVDGQFLPGMQEQDRRGRAVAR